MAFRKAMKVDDPLLRSVLVAAVAALLAGCAPEVPPVEPVRPAIVHQVAMSAAGVPAVFAGEVKARHEVDLGFRVSGKIVSRQVDVGARVRRGQVLARLDSSDLTLQSDAAAAQLAAAETDLALARSELQRYRGLHAQNFVSQSALEQRQAAFDAATARRRQASSQLEVSRNQAGYAALVADADGVVTAVMAETGQVVTAGQAVVRMALAGAREVAINVPENRIAEVKDAAGLAIALWS
jgi:RND family efflux transporter MFP subunit